MSWSSVGWYLGNIKLLKLFNSRKTQNHGILGAKCLQGTPFRSHLQPWSADSRGWVCVAAVTQVLLNSAGPLLRNRSISATSESYKTFCLKLPVKPEHLDLRRCQTVPAVVSENISNRRLIWAAHSLSVFLFAYYLFCLRLITAYEALSVRRSSFFRQLGAPYFARLAAWWPTRVCLC
jgi:hypothetical protein